MFNTMIIILTFIVIFYFVSYQFRLSHKRIIVAVSKYEQMSPEKRDRSRILKKMKKKYKAKFEFWRRHKRLMWVCERTLIKFHKDRYYILGNVLVLYIIPFSQILSRLCTLNRHFPRRFFIRSQMLLLIPSLVFVFILNKLFKRIRKLSQIDKLPEKHQKILEISKRSVIICLYYLCLAFSSIFFFRFTLIYFVSNFLIIGVVIIAKIRYLHNKRGWFLLIFSDLILLAYFFFIKGFSTDVTRDNYAFFFDLFYVMLNVSQILVIVSKFIPIK